MITSSNLASPDFCIKVLYIVPTILAAADKFLSMSSMGRFGSSATKERAVLIVSTMVIPAARMSLGFSIMFAVDRML